MIRRFFGFFFNRYVFIALGLAAIALVIWYAGPLFAFADWRPLGPERVRAWTIALLFLFLFVRFVVVRFWRDKHVNARLVDAAMGMREKQPPAEHDPAHEALEEMRGSFRQALKQLKKAGFGRRDGWWARLNQKYLYQIPWYVFIGAPGSGKTTALVHSGLRFPLAEETGKEAVPGVAGTRNCDWWFAEQTVLIDTAGRYTMQDSDPTADKVEWEGFLRLLRKFRPRQPLNGAILTLSVADLMDASEDERRGHVKRLRARLRELTDNLGISFPVYVLVTKVDLLGGFNEFFGRLDRSERSQVWGATLPAESSAEGPGQASGEQLRGAMDALVRRLFDMQPDWMASENDLARRARAYVLPQYFARLSSLVQGIVGEIFSDQQATSAANLRGVYFTSGTQTGMPFDRLLCSLSADIGLAPEVAVPAGSASGKSFFLTDLFTKVVFPEAHLAGRNHRREQREKLLRIAGHGALLAVLLGTCLAWWVSYRNNKAYIQSVEAKTALVGEQLDEVAQSRSSSTLERLPLLTAIKHLADGTDFTVVAPPLAYRWGLFQGEKLDAAAQIAYQRGLDRLLLPTTVRRVTERLRSSPNDDLALKYQTLKTYLMLNQPEHYQPDQVLAFVETAWMGDLPPSTTQAPRAELGRHLAAMLMRPVVSSPYPLDKELVAAQRQQLASYSLADRAYQRMKQRYLEGELPPFTVAETAGPLANLVFARKSGEPLTEGVSGFYTYQGYYELFKPAVGPMLRSLRSDDAWVLGRTQDRDTERLKALASGEVARNVTRLYLHEYVNRWLEYLGDVRVVTGSSMLETVETARLLSAPDSPLAQFLRAVARETTLLKHKKRSTADQSMSVLGRGKRRLELAKQDLQRVIGPVELPGSSNGVELERIVDDQFQPIRQLVNAENGSVSLAAAMQLFNDIYMSLSGTQAMLRGRVTSSPDPKILSRIRAQAGYYPMPVRNLLNQMVDQAGRASERGLRHSLSAELNGSIGDFCRRAISGRYPFRRTSRRDVTLVDFSRLFASGGLFDQFFERNLRARVDQSGPNWLLRMPAGGTTSLTQFQRAAQIREAFFHPGSNKVGLSFDFRILEMDASILHASFDFDGLLFHYAHGPQVLHHVEWPGPRGNQQVRLVVKGVDGSEGQLVETGPWAALRLFDEGESRPAGGPERFIVTFLVDGQRIVMEVTADSVVNPFHSAALDNFSCPSGI